MARLVEWARSREGLLLLVILLLGAGLRVARLLEAAEAPDFAYPAIDAGFNDYWARSLVQPDWRPPEHLPDPQIATSPCLRPPGYPWFLAAVYAASGGSYLAPRLIQALLGLLSTVLLYALGRRWFSPATGLGAAALFSTNWVSLYFETELHEPALLMFLLLLLAAACDRWAAAPGVRRALLAGLALGGTALVRSNILLGLPALLLWMLWVLRKTPAGVGRNPDTGARGRSRPAAMAACLLGTALAIAPATARNLIVSGEPVLISANAGLNLLLGNNPRATGLIGDEIPGLGSFDNFYDYPAILRALERREGHPLDHRSASALFTSEALDFVADSPGEFLELTARKAALFWGPAEVSHNKVLPLERAASPILAHLPGPFPLYLAAALVGLAQLILARRRSHPMVSWSAGLLVIWFLSVLPFFAAARYRLPVLPILILLGSEACVCTWRHLRRQRGRAVLMAAASFAVLFYLASQSPLRQPLNRAKWHMDRGHAQARAGDAAAAAAEFEQALRASPHAPDVHYSLALQAMAAGQLAAAEEHYRATLAADSKHSGALTNLGSLLVDSGRLAEGLELLEAALARDLGRTESRHNLALALRRAGRLQAAIGHWRVLLAADQASVATHKLLASTLLEAGDPGAAAEHLGHALELEPEQLEHKHELAWLLATCSVDAVRDGARAEALMGQVLGAGGESPRWLATLAAAQAERGNFAAARATTQRALDLAVSSGKTRRAAALRATMKLYRDNKPQRSGP
jgi:tetratricopeptide (TPR) repeat protein